MIGSRKIRNLFGVLGLSIGTSFGVEMDCGKITPRFCPTLSEAQSDTQKFAAVIMFVQPEYPEVDSSCTGVDPKNDTTGKCGNDTAYYAFVRAKLVEYGEDLLTTYELWDVENPSQLLTSTSVPIRTFYVIATKATLVNVSREDYVFKVDLYEEPGPAKIQAQGRGTTYREIIGAKAFLINGRRLDARTRSMGPKMIRPLQ
jgi:hypothetical protein